MLLFPPASDANFIFLRAYIERQSPVSRLDRHAERHLISRIGWLRAAVLGANDGIVSIASLIVGVAAAHALKNDILLAGAAGLVAGAMSMAAGEYVSVSSQSDTEKADLAREAEELSSNRAAEVLELAGLYAARGVEPVLARQVAEQLMAKDALSAHARDELGISKIPTDPGGIHLGRHLHSGRGCAACSRVCRSNGVGYACGGLGGPRLPCNPRRHRCSRWRRKRLKVGRTSDVLGGVRYGAHGGHRQTVLRDSLSNRMRAAA